MDYIERKIKSCIREAFFLGVQANSDIEKHLVKTNNPYATLNQDTETELMARANKITEDTYATITQYIKYK